MLKVPVRIEIQRSIIDNENFPQRTVKQKPLNLWERVRYVIGLFVQLTEWFRSRCFDLVIQSSSRFESFRQMHIFYRLVMFLYSWWIVSYVCVLSNIQKSSVKSRFFVKLSDYLLNTHNEPTNPCSGRTARLIISTHHSC